MPRDSNGNASLDPVYKAVTGQLVQAIQHNTPLEDIVSMLTGSLPRNGSAPMIGNLPMAGFKVTGLGYGTAITDAAAYGQVLAASPIGIVVDYAGFIPPDGWLLCYGQAVSRTTYAALFTAISTQFGAGDGSTTFNVPDLRGIVTAGLETMGGGDSGRLSSFYGAIARTLGGLLGTSSVTLTTGQMPSHNHGGVTSSAGTHSHGFTYNSVGGSGGDAGGGSGFTRFFPASGTTDAGGSHDHPIPSDGGGQAHSNAQPTRMMNKIIKAL